jgi:hypothetical protein
VVTVSSYSLSRVCREEKNVGRNAMMTGLVVTQSEILHFNGGISRVTLLVLSKVSDTIRRT